MRQQRYLYADFAFQILVTAPGSKHTNFLPALAYFSTSSIWQRYI
jgi:hypothetical protein